MQCEISEKIFFFYWCREDYLLIVDVSQDAGQDLQQENTQQQDEVLRTHRRREMKKRIYVLGMYLKLKLLLKHKADEYIL